MALVALIAALLAVGPGASAAVPAHGRAWELVTSEATNGVRVLGGRAWSADGDRVVYASLGSMPGAPSGDLTAQGLATRTASGWTQQPIGEPLSIPSADLFASGPLAISPDFSSWLWASNQPLLPGAPPPPDTDLYRGHADGTLELLGAVGGSRDYGFVDATDDLQHVVFQSQAHLLPADAARTSGGDAYEFVGSDLRLVGVDSAGLPISPCGSAVGNGDPETGRLMHAVSHDGARIFFSAPASADCGQPRRVYLRENGSQTTEISASACTRADCDAPQDVSFVGALRDGSSAFLVTAQQLTDDDVDESPDLYRYDVADHALTRLSSGPPGVPANVLAAAVRTSADGARVYFVAFGALVPGQGVDGQSNLYLSDHGQLRFVAPANEVDLSAASITADGGTLVFTTSSTLLPSDVDDNFDIYRYEAASGSLEQISTGPGGRGNGGFGVTFGSNGSLTPLDGGRALFMSADGRRVFFATGESLLPEDVNQTPDVYEWADGDLGLLSSGTGDDSVRYAGASADGRSVFFKTNQTLVPADRNGGDEDLYVARLGGGFPSPPAPPPACEEDACQGSPGARLERPQPGSLAGGGETPPLAFRIHALARRARSQLAALGRAAVVVEVPAAGRVSLVASARIGGRAIVVARTAVDVRAAGSVRMELRLSAAGRRALRRRHELRLRLVVRHARLGAAPAVAVTLRSAA